MRPLHLILALLVPTAAHAQDRPQPSVDWSAMAPASALASAYPATAPTAPAEPSSGSTAMRVAGGTLLGGIAGSAAGAGLGYAMGSGDALVQLGSAAVGAAAGYLLGSGAGAHLAAGSTPLESSLGRAVLISTASAAVAGLLGVGASAAFGHAFEPTGTGDPPPLHKGEFAVLVSLPAHIITTTYLMHRFGQ